MLFVTPEYNRSVPGVLKNAIDCGSRPYGQSAWSGKPGGVVSVSVGAIGGFGANHHLRQSMVFARRGVTRVQHIVDEASAQRTERGPRADFTADLIKAKCSRPRALRADEVADARFRFRRRAFRAAQRETRRSGCRLPDLVRVFT